MVAKIKSGKSLIGALNYNEHKVALGRAELIGAMGYFRDTPLLSFYDKLLRLTDLAARNERTQTNAVHISLNFSNGENLSDQKLNAIAGDYMTGIGFEDQPYLTYRHEDAGHPHIHIVTTNINRNGERISLHYLGQNESEKARKAVEIKFGLIRAEEQQQQKPDPETVLEIANYGKSETKRMITNIVNATIRNYKFTSIPELNAVLAQYNIYADRGSKDSRMYAQEGLVYWILDHQGNKVGVPIKASSIYGKPTLRSLEQKFRLNEELRKSSKAGLIQILDLILAKPQTKGSFQKALNEKSIQCILRQGPSGRLYGVTFIDQINKSVFNGSDLGKSYSANLLNAQFQPESITKSVDRESSIFMHSYHTAGSHTGWSNELSDILFAAEHDEIAAHSKSKRKKRKRLNL